MYTNILSFESYKMDKNLTINLTIMSQFNKFFVIDDCQMSTTGTLYIVRFLQHIYNVHVFFLLGFVVKRWVITSFDALCCFFLTAVP
jgi:hypothetical protein